MSITSSTHSRGGSYGASQFGDTTLTKVFVGGLAWETPRDSLREHFETYGEILEAVIIYDKITGRSKGYGFVTFKEGEAAEKACEDNAPIINGRKANCNLASLGVKRDKPAANANIITPTLISTPSRSSPPPQNVAAINNTIPPALNNTVPIPASANGVRWYYPAAPRQQAAVPFNIYGYSPSPTAYVAPNHMNYNQGMQKMGFYNVGFYSNGQVYPVGAAGHQMMMPMLYPFYNHQQMSFPTHVFPAIHRVPALVPKPTAFVPAPNPGAMVGV